MTITKEELEARIVALEAAVKNMEAQLQQHWSSHQAMSNSLNDRFAAVSDRGFFDWP